MLPPLEPQTIVPAPVPALAASHPSREANRSTRLATLPSHENLMRGHGARHVPPPFRPPPRRRRPRPRPCQAGSRRRPRGRCRASRPGQLRRAPGRPRQGSSRAAAGPPVVAVRLVGQMRVEGCQAREVAAVIAPAAVPEGCFRPQGLRAPPPTRSRPAGRRRGTCGRRARGVRHRPGRRPDGRPARTARHQVVQGHVEAFELGVARSLAESNWFCLRVITARTADFERELKDFEATEGKGAESRLTVTAAGR